MVRARSPVGGKYDTAIDRESAFEVLAQRAATAPAAPATAGKAAKADAKADAKDSGVGQMAHDMLFGTGRRQGMLEAMGKSMARNAGSRITNAIMRGIFGSMKR